MAEQKRKLRTGEKVLFGVFGFFMLAAAVGFYFMDVAVQKNPGMFKPVTHYDFSAAGQHGSDVYHHSGCSACHRAMQEGTNMGLDLDGTGSKYSRERIYAFLKHPKQTYGAPTVDHSDVPAAAAYVAELPDEKLQAIATFLSELKADRGSSAAALPPEGRSEFIDNMLKLWAPDSWKSKYRDVREDDNK